MKPYRFAALVIIAVVLMSISVGALSVGVLIGARVFEAVHEEGCK